MKERTQRVAKFLALWLLFFLLSIIVRLPHLLSRHLYFDIDEAVVGIMAQDLLESGKVPYYFYLQNYGLSFFETVSAALFIALFGSTVWALKFGGLLIYSLGVTFLFRMLEEKWAMKKWVLWLLAFFILCYPTWYIWGSMLRGGYVTAFTASCSLLYLIVTKQVKPLTLFMAALLLYISCDAHLLIGIGMVPLVIHWLWSSESRWTSSGIFALTFVGAIATSRVLFFHSNYGLYSKSLNLSEMIHSFIQNMEGFHAAFTNYFSYSKAFSLPSYWLVFSWILIALAGATFLIALVVCSKKTRWIIVMSIVGAIGSMLAIAASPTFAPRYLLGFWTMVLFSVLLSVGALVSHKPGIAKGIVTGIAALAFIGITAGSKIPRHWSSKPVPHLEGLEDLFHEMKGRGVKATVSIDNTTVWNFMYGDQIPSVGICGLDRTEKFKDRVYEVYLKDSTKIAVFGHWGSDAGMREFKEYEAHFGGERTGFFWIMNPSKPMLEKARENSGCEYKPPLFERHTETH